MEKILIDQNPHWDNKLYDHFTQRSCVPDLLSLLTLKEIIVLLGVRRSGKTTLFRLLINHLIKTNDPKTILYINLDDPYFDDVSINAKSLYKIVENAERLTKTKVHYLFLDEIQNIIGWEKFIKSIYDSEIFKKICITGSNSSLLQGNYAKLLSGRYVNQFVFPLSIQEAFSHHHISDQLTLIKEKSKVLSLLDSLLVYGGFPEVFLQDDESLKRKILTGYYETILLKDCIVQGNIRDIRLIKELSYYLITHIAATYSYLNLSKIFDSNEHTLKSYIDTLENGFLFNEIKSFSYSLKQQAKGKKKLYCVDNGLASSVAFSFSSNKGKLFENMVYGELKKIGCQEIFFLNEAKECDFIIKEKNKILPIQACYHLNEENQKREIQGLQLAMEKTKSKLGLIVTFDQEETNSNIHVIPIWKLFFQKTLHDLFTT